MKAIFHLSISGSKFFQQDFIIKKVIEVRMFLKIFCNFAAAWYFLTGLLPSVVVPCYLLKIKKGVLNYLAAHLSFIIWKGCNRLFIYDFLIDLVCQENSINFPEIFEKLWFEFILGHLIPWISLDCNETTLLIK